MVRRLRTGDETLEEGLVLEVFVVLLEMLFRGGHELDGGELVAGRSQFHSYHPMGICVTTHPLRSKRWMISPMRPRCAKPVNQHHFQHHSNKESPYLDAIRFNSNEATTH